MKNRIALSLSRLLGRNTLQALVIGLAASSLSLSATAALAADKSKLMTEVHFDPGSTDVTFGGKKKRSKRPSPPSRNTIRAKST